MARSVGFRSSLFFEFIKEADRQGLKKVEPIAGEGNRLCMGIFSFHGFLYRCHYLRQLVRHRALHPLVRSALRPEVSLSLPLSKVANP